MSLKEYLKDNLRYFILWLLMLGIIDFFLIMFKITSSLIWIITIVILSSMIIIYGYDYYRKRVFYQDFITKLNKLDKKCLITELIKKPNFLDGKILYDSLYEIDKSMYEESCWFFHSLDKPFQNRFLPKALYETAIPFPA